MAKRVSTVAELAGRAHIDVDEMLIRLWDVGLDQYREPGDKIRRRDMGVALSAAQLPSKRELTSPEYWMEQLKANEAELREVLRQLGLTMAPHAKTLPRGAVTKLRRLVASKPIVLEQAIEAGAPNSQQEHVEAAVWRTVGQPRPIRLLSESEVEGIHWELVRDFASDSDPIDPAGVRDPDLLASAVFRQHTSFGTELKYPSVEMVAAALFHALVHDHPFHNGNKRTALVSMLVLLDENAMMMTEECAEDELFELVLRLAQHKIVPSGKDLADRETLYLAEWIRAHARSIERGDRPVQWRRLRQILTGFGCELTLVPGGKVNITRVIEEPRRLRTRRQTIATQVKYTDEGREAQLHTLKKIRRDLWLDEEHGVDSQSFYQMSGLMPSAFIVKYRRTLKRLAKL
jgi:death-on-curing family protein